MSNPTHEISIATLEISMTTLKITTTELLEPGGESRANWNGIDGYQRRVTDRSMAT